MQHSLPSILFGVAILSVANAHGSLKSPAPRMPGPAMQAACGQQVYNNQASDHFGNIQGEMQVASSQPDFNPTKCNLNLCKGYQFADANASTIYSYKPGQTIPMNFDLRAPHTGKANVSVIDTAANKPIGTPLIAWDTFASNASPVPDSQLNFQVTMPDLGAKCAQPGACVIQHWWDATSINQTYESCLDFTMNGGGGGGSGGSAPSSVSVPAPAPSSVASTLSTSVRQPSVTSVGAATSVPPMIPAPSPSSSAAASSVASAPTPSGSGADDGADEDCDEL